jgi:hypothetical protein
MTHEMNCFPKILQLTPFAPSKTATPTMAPVMHWLDDVGNPYLRKGMKGFNILARQDFSADRWRNTELTEQSTLRVDRSETLQAYLEKLLFLGVLPMSN